MFDRLSFKMNHINPTDVSLDLVNAQAKIIGSLHDAYTEQGAKSTTFAKAWKYSELYNWAVQFCQVVIAAHEEKELADKVKGVESQRDKLVNENEVAKLCLEDMAIYQVDALVSEMEEVERFVTWCDSAEREGKMIQV